MKISTIFLITLLVGCATSNNLTDTNKTIFTPEECKNVAPYWYGDKGEDPSKNDVWKCFQWKIQKR